MYKLRDYQQEFLDKLLATQQNTVGVLPTGGGKSCVVAKMVRHFVEKGEPVHIWVHRNLLVKQLIKTLNHEGFSPGVIQGPRKPKYSPVQIVSVQTLIRRDPRSILKPARVIVDECHRISEGNTYGKLLDLYSPKQTYGLTATPCRTDGKGLGDLFPEMVLGPNTKNLIDRGALSPFTMLACKSAISGLKGKKRGTDYVFEQLDTGEFNGELVRDYKKHINGKKVIVFCMNKEHAESVCAKYNQEGVAALTLLDHHKEKERDEIVSKLETSNIQALIVVNIPTEGFDCPCVDAVQIAFKTVSIMKWLQAIGRCLRLFPGKTMAYVLDHSDNHLRLPWPTSNIQWSLTETPIVLEDEVKIKDPITDIIIEKELKELDITELGTELEVIGLEEIQEAQEEQRRQDILTSFDLHLETARIRNHKPYSAYVKTLEQYDYLLDLEVLHEISKKLGYDFRWKFHAQKQIEEKLGF